MPIKPEILTMIEEHRKESRRISAELKRLLPEGAEVLFKYGNMTSYRRARINFADYYSGDSRICTTNFETGKRRFVPVKAIHSDGLRG